MSTKVPPRTPQLPIVPQVSAQRVTTPHPNTGSRGPGVRRPRRAGEAAAHDGAAMDDGRGPSSGPHEDDATEAPRRATARAHGGTGASDAAAGANAVAQAGLRAPVAPRAKVGHATPSAAPRLGAGAAPGTVGEGPSLAQLQALARAVHAHYEAAPPERQAEANATFARLDS